MEYPGWSLDANPTVSLPSHAVLDMAKVVAVAGNGNDDDDDDDDDDAAMIVGVNRYVESRRGCKNQCVFAMVRPLRPICATDGSDNIPMVDESHQMGLLVVTVTVKSLEHNKPPWMEEGKIWLL